MTAELVVVGLSMVGAAYVVDAIARFHRRGLERLERAGYR